MRAIANRHRRDVNFEVGDKVLLKLQQYRQHSVAKPLSAKLGRRYYGPFVIVERIGPVAYRLQLPSAARIHDVFHVSLLKKFVEGVVAVPGVALPQEFVGSKPVLKPMELLDRRMALQGGKAIEQVLVSWSTDGTVVSTWEPYDYITRRFPHLLEDKECPIRGGIDTGIQPAIDEVTANNEELLEVEELVEESEEEEEERDKKDRPKRRTRPPVKYGDYTSY
ncbi:hypothetical protein AAHA92_04351 [Salvia divinorum]